MMMKKLKHRKKGGSAFLTDFLVLMVLGIVAVAVLFPGCHGLRYIREAEYTPGIYEGSGRGYRGPIHVQVQVSPAGIEDIVITGHEESVYPGAAAMEELLDLVLETGSTDLDAVSGATFSSRGFLDAVEDAIVRAYQP